MNMIYTVHSCYLIYVLFDLNKKLIKPSCFFTFLINPITSGVGKSKFTVKM